MELENLDKIIKEITSTLVVDLTNKNKVVDELTNILHSSVKNNIADNSKFGIAFSGGVDSTLIAFLCKRFKKNFKLYSVGVGEKEDLIWSRKIATNLKIPILAKNIEFDEAFEIIKKVTNLLNESHPVKVGIGCTLYSVFNLMKNDNMEHAVTGLGSDTIFCGFEKYRKALENGTIMEECLNGIKKIHENDVKRDLKIAKNFKLNLICPYLDKELIAYGMRIHPSLKIDNVEKKICLREAAFNMGLKREFAYRKKLAAQYGSGFDKVIGIFAKENGFKTKNEFLGSLLKKPSGKND